MRRPYFLLKSNEMAILGLKVAKQRDFVWINRPKFNKKDPKMSKFSLSVFLPGEEVVPIKERLICGIVLPMTEIVAELALTLKKEGIMKGYLEPTTIFGLYRFPR